MGIDLYCDNIYFGTCYSRWDEIRSEIIRATIDYIQDKYYKDKALYGHLNEDHDNYMGAGTTYHFYMVCLEKAKNDILTKTQHIIIPELIIPIPLGFVGSFVKYCKDNIGYMNALNYFDIGGLFALCNQSDCEGHYTPGNSLDICSLFDRIEPFVKKYDCYNCIYMDEGRSFNKLYDVFEHSYKVLKKVKIC